MTAYKIINSNNDALSMISLKIIINSENTDERTLVQIDANDNKEIISEDLSSIDDYIKTLKSVHGDSFNSEVNLTTLEVGVDSFWFEFCDFSRG